MAVCSKYLKFFYLIKQYVTLLDEDFVLVDLKNDKGLVFVLIFKNT